MRGSHGVHNYPEGILEAVACDAKSIVDQEEGKVQEYGQHERHHVDDVL